MNIKTTIPFDRLVAIAREEGCPITEKGTSTMVGKAGGNRLYIAKTRDVARVNINGFKIPDPGLAMTPPGGPVGTFLQVVRFDLPEATVLANFRHICRNLERYTPEPKKPRGRPAGFRGTKHAEPQGPSVEVQALETPAQHADRLVREFQKKRAIAAEMGRSLSPKTVESYRQKLADLGRTLEA